MRAPAKPPQGREREQGKGETGLRVTGAEGEEREKGGRGTGKGGREAKRSGEDRGRSNDDGRAKKNQNQGTTHANAEDSKESKKL